MDQAEKEVSDQILAGIRDETLRAPDRVEGLVFKRKVWEVSVRLALTATTQWR